MESTKLFSSFIYKINRMERWHRTWRGRRRGRKGGGCGGGEELSVCQVIAQHSLYSPQMASGDWDYSESGGHPESPTASRQSPQDSASHTCTSVGTKECGSQRVSFTRFLLCSHQLWSVQSSLGQTVYITKVTMLLQQ